MPVAVNQPQRREKEADPLDTIIKGLSIATSIYGIKDGMDKAKILEAERAAKAEQQTQDNQFKTEELRIKDKEASRRAVQDPTVTEYKNLRLDKMRQEMENANNKAMEGKTERLSGKLQSGADLNSAINNLEGTLGFSLDDFDPKTGKAKMVENNSVVEKEIDLPGASVPGLGRVSFYDSGARDLNAKVAKIFNVELKDRSGAAVTTPELDRLKQEFASGKFNTEAEMLGALRDYKNAFRDASKNIEAGFDPAAVSLVGDRGGFNSSKISGSKLEESAKGKVAGGGLAQSVQMLQKNGPNGPVVRQDGVEYKWNPKTGKYE